jgi:hypothetical protein
MSRYICGFKVNYHFSFILLPRFVQIRTLEEEVNVTNPGGGSWEFERFGETPIV